MGTKREPVQQTFHLRPNPMMDGALVCDRCWNTDHHKCEEHGCQCWHHDTCKPKKAAQAAKAETLPELFSSGGKTIEV